MNKFIEINILLSVCIAALALTACGGGGGNGAGAGTISITPDPTESCATLNSSDPDQDNDGLSDCYEVFIGTSPSSADSDGDGVDDYDEVVTKAFDPTIDNFKFNPRIADVPEISVQFENIPEISIDYSTTASESNTTGVKRTNESATTLINSETQAQSVTEEVSSTLGSSGGSSGFDINSSTTYSASVQDTLSWTETQIQENRSSLTTMRQKTSESGVTNTSGNISVLLKVINKGSQSVTLNDMTITALQVNPNDPAKQSIVTAMNFGSNLAAFPSIDIAPDSQSNQLPFSGKILLGKTFELLQDSRNLSIEPTTWRITDQDQRSYTHKLTNVLARSAQVIIDYAGSSAGNKQIEKYYVATVTDFGRNRISATTALTDVLRLPYVEGTNSALHSGSFNGLLSVRDVDSDDTIKGHWLVIHNYIDTNSNSRVSKTYDSKIGNYSLDDINIAKNEVLHLMYVKDQDGDGIASREEFLHGTLDNNQDFDNDQLTDYEEIRQGWEVPVSKTLTRMVYSDPKVADADNDALADGAERDKGSNPNKRDTDNDGILDDVDTDISITDMQEVAFLPLAQNSINDSSYNADVGISGSYSHTADRFGTPNAALNISQDADQLDVFNVFASAPANGSTLIVWFKANPGLPADGWNLYEHRQATDNFANQFFWMYPGGFTVFGDSVARHSIFANQNDLFEQLPFADWHMVAMVGEEETVNGGMKRFKVYYDGKLYSSVSHPTTLVELFTHPWYFAGQSNYNVGLGEYLGGLDDIRFFKRALDSEEIKLMYQAQQ